MAAYYNEFKPEAAHMLRRLIRDGLIADGEVDERSITEVSSDDIKGFTQCHFFAGIGGWSVALRLAMWPDDRPVWTGSCPCQPFSTAGKQKGKEDERHLWPVWAKLIRECRPATVFGEQVSSAVAYGWWDDVANDLEAEGYACAAAVLPACSVGKPHKRERLWFVANSQLRGCECQPKQHPTSIFSTMDGTPKSRKPISAYGSGTLGDSQHHGWHGRPLIGSDGATVSDDTQGAHGSRQLEGTGESSHVADTSLTRLEGHGRHEQQYDAQGREKQDGHAGAANLQWIACPDGKSRPVEPSICLLAHGVQHRASLLHGYGNAIVPQVAAEFIKATKGATK